jgi:hypothetical protein
MGTLRDKEISKPKLEKSHASNEPAYVHTLAGAFAGLLGDYIKLNSLAIALIFYRVSQLRLLNSQIIWFKIP